MNVAVVGYGNLGKALCKAIDQQTDMQLTAVFSRRNIDHPLYQPTISLNKYVGKIDCLALALGSYDDITSFATRLASQYNIVDSYDNHNNIAQYKSAINSQCLRNQTTAIVSVGWDPGLMSIIRAYNSILPNCVTSSFWGKGVSQGHSNAIRSIPGVINAIQYTVPKPQSIDNAITNHIATDSHLTHDRVCYVACQQGDQDRIYRTIVSMPDYFEPYNTIVNFVSPQEVTTMQQDLSHRGQIITHSDVADTNFSLITHSNPLLTANIMCSYIRALGKLNINHVYGCYDCLDIAPSYLINNKNML